MTGSNIWIDIASIAGTVGVWAGSVCNEADTASFATTTDAVVHSTNARATAGEILTLLMLMVTGISTTWIDSMFNVQTTV